MITGPNGIGKTSLCEALWIYHGRYNPTIIWSYHIQRRQVTDPNPLIGLGGQPIQLEGLEGDQQFGVKIEFEERLSVLPIARQEIDKAPQDIESDGEGSFESPPPQTGTEDVSLFPMLGRLSVTYNPDLDSRTETHEVVLGPTGPGLARRGREPRRPSGIIVTRAGPFPITGDTIDRFSDVVMKGEKRELLDSLRVVQPTINDIEIISRKNTSSLWADIGTKGLLPVEALGGGVVRLLTLFVNFFSARDGLILIDEIENGIHHSAQLRLWRQIMQMSAILNVQCVATTHSLECVRAAASSGENGQAPPEFALHHLHPKDGAREIETYTGEKLMAALDVGFEVR